MTTAGPPDAPARLWVACPQLGGDSEVWLWRQVTRLDGVDTIVTGERRNAGHYPVEGPTVLVRPDVRLQERGTRRWVDRARGALSGNHYALPPATTRDLVDHARRGRPDVLLCHFGHIALRMLPLSRALDVPVVVHFHGLDLSSGLANRWYRWSLRRSLPRMAGAIVVGSHQREVLVDLGMPPDRIEVIPCGVPTSDFAPVARDPHAPRGRIRFITVVRLVPQKGVAYVIEALARLTAEGVEAELHVVGDGTERAVLEDLARRLDVADRVVFHGFRPQADVRDLLADADVYVQHSIRHGGSVEGFGVSLTEAAAMGLPIVATRTGGILDQVVDGQTGYLVPERDVAAMAERMRRLVDDPELARSLGTRARARAVDHFDTDRQVARLADVLQRVAATAGRAGLAAVPGADGVGP